MPQPFRVRKQLRLKNFDYSSPSQVYFLTLCACHLSAPFKNAPLSKEIIRALAYVRSTQNGKIYCHCLMPDHLHIAMSPCKETIGVSQIIGQFKSFTTRIAWDFGIEGKLWQKSFYDHIAREDEDLVSICRYILANPVRKGLVTKPEHWKFSGMWDSLPI